MTAVTSPVFVGRDAELSKLDGALNLASQGRASFVIIGGDAGVGKSRLLAAWNEGQRQGEARIAVGACLDLGDSGPAYVSIAHAFRDLFQTLDPALLETVVGRDREILGRMLPELATHPAGDVNVEPSTPVVQARLFNSLLRMLERAAAAVPLVLELEDIHWADPSTRAFLVYLAGNLRAARILLITTVRSGLDGQHPVKSVLEQIHRHPNAFTIDLLPFDEIELRAQVRGILGQAPTGRLVSAIHARSEGNALFAEELLAMRDPTRELPTSIADALHVRTVGLTTDARTALRAASVAGRTASYDLIRAASGLPEDRLDAALHEVVDAGVLEPDHATEEYRFRHALLQEATYADALPGERRRLHASIAEVLERDVLDTGDDPELASRLAYHWLEARDDSRALQASLRAGDAASQQAANAEALRHYKHVLRLWERAPHSHGDHQRIEILERATRAANLADNPHEAVVLAADALDGHVFADDPTRHVRLLEAIVEAKFGLHDEEGALEYETRLAGLTEDDLPDRERLAVASARVSVFRWQGDFDAASVAATDAIRIASDMNDPQLAGHAQLMVGFILGQGGALDASLASARRAYELADLSGEERTALDAMLLMLEVHLAAGRDEDVIAVSRAARAYSRQVGLAELAHFTAVYEAGSLLELGRIHESAEAVHAALLDPPPNRSDASALHLQAGEVDIVRGAYQEAAAHVEDARLPEAFPGEQQARGWLATVRANLALATSRYDDIGAIMAGTGPILATASPYSQRMQWLWRLTATALDAQATRAEHARAAGNESGALAAGATGAALVAALENAAHRFRASGLPQTLFMDREEGFIAGHLARLEGRDEPDVWEAVAARFPPRSPRALAARYRQAEAMLERRMPRDDVVALVARAHADAVEMGAQPMADQFEALARRARIDLSAREDRPSLSTAGPPLVEELPPGTAALRTRGLSDREIEVLTLVAAGFSNQAIGERLFITDKTASAHVSHILAKLAVATRTEAATLGVRLGLPLVTRHEEPAPSV